MKIELEIIRITVLCSPTAPDKIDFETTLPDACYPFTGTQNLWMTCAAGKAEEWLKQNLGIVPDEVISMNPAREPHFGK